MSTTEPQPSPPSLSDLCLLAVLGEMNLKSRLAASKVCPRWFHRVREVNQAVRSIAIAVQGRGEEEDGWRSELLDGHRGAIESEPSVRLLKKADGSPLEPPPLTAADCLLLDELSNIITAQQIIAAFPCVTELVFLGRSNGEEYQQYLVEMLVSPVWRGQLTRLRLIDRSSSGCRQQRRLFAAINGLTSLRQLTLDLVSGDLSLLNLSALGQLETVHIDCLQGLVSFLDCLQQYAASGLSQRGGAALPRVELIHISDYLKELGTLSLPLRRLVARLVEEEPMSGPRRSIASVLTTYPALSSLALRIPPWLVRQVFADLASLGGGGLFHLRLDVDFDGRFNFDHTGNIGSDDDSLCSYSYNYNEGEAEDRWADWRPFRPPVAALPSVRALDLWVALTSHADLEWFNLPVTMPALEALHLGVFDCARCMVGSRSFEERDTAARLNPLYRSECRQCLRAVFGIFSRTGLPPGQMAFLGEENLCSVEELLNEEELSS